MTKSELDNYLDDFFFADISFNRAVIQLDSLENLCLDIGVPQAPEKTEGPALVLIFLGLTLDAENCRVVFCPL